MTSHAPGAPSVAPADIVVNVCSSDDRERWNAVVADSPGGSFYHLFDWTAVNERYVGARSIPLVASLEGRWVGVLPLVLVTSRVFGRILCSMPFVNFGGPCSRDADVEHALARAAIQQADELSVDYLELRCTHTLDLGLHESLRKVSMSIDLSPGADALWNNFSSKHRNNVKRAYKHGLEVQGGGIELLPIFYAILEESWHKLGTPLYSPKYFEGILRAFPESTGIFVCRRGGEPIAATFNGYFNGVVEGMWAGGTDAAREFDANYVLYWEMIRDACQRGCQTFHLGRSTADSGAEQFKKRWNATAKQLYWYFHRPDGGAIPQLNVDNPRYRLAIAAWQKAPRWFVRWLGPRLARAIP